MRKQDERQRTTKEEGRREYALAFANWNVAGIASHMGDEIAMEMTNIITSFS